MNSKKQRKKKKYYPPKLERFKIDDLAKSWDLASLDIAVSCKDVCGP